MYSTTLERQGMKWLFHQVIMVMVIRQWFDGGQEMDETTGRSDDGCQDAMHIWEVPSTTSRGKTR